jgi:hypothetical protein
MHWENNERAGGRGEQEFGQDHFKQVHLTLKHFAATQHPTFRDRAAKKPVFSSI